MFLEGISRVSGRCPECAIQQLCWFSKTISGPKIFGTQIFLGPEICWIQKKILGMKKNCAQKNLQSQTMFGPFSRSVWHIPDTFPTPTRCLPGTFQTPILSPSPNKNLQAFSVKQNQVGIVLLVLVLLLLVTLENKVNSNSDQFKFVQLSSKSGWSLTKNQQSLRKLIKHFEDYNIPVMTSDSLGKP